MRALLIQKDVKQSTKNVREGSSLRALLIQKDVKLKRREETKNIGLRALLIQKDVKQILAASLGIMV